MRAAAFVWVSLAIVMLAGCAARPTGEAAIYGKAPEGTTMQEVRTRTGLPNAMRFLGSGEEVWEFNDRRVGWGGWRVVFELDGKVREIKSIRRPEDIARLKTGGATGQEVLELLGEPGGVSFTGQDAVWEYCLPDRSRLKVRFGEGKRVVAIEG
ncbi:MAG: outer membrane protein assembly factor BamE [Burkholderiales bacterium]|nr:outer membrane protein assembly factor BamE [Burkholderiales bacterium]